MRYVNNTKYKGEAKILKTGTCAPILVESSIYLVFNRVLTLNSVAYVSAAIQEQVRQLVVESGVIEYVVISGLFRPFLPPYFEELCDLTL